MATFWIDLKNGNDSNSGTYLSPWLTFINGPTSARIAPGDEVRIMRTPTYTLANTTWTNGSGGVTIPSGAVLDIDTAVGNTWSVSTNVTGSTSTNRRLGATAQQLAVAAGFTTGKIARKTTPPLNLSSYTKFSFFLRSNIGFSKGVLTLRLCSDTTGDTAVHTYTIPGLGSNQFYALTFDNGGPLSSNINSVSLWAESDPGTVTYIINNIIAHNDLGLSTVVGPSSEESFYAPLSISGTTLRLDRNMSVSATAGAWSGTTGDYTMIIRELIVRPSTFSVNESGNADFLMSGGWENETTQNGYTLLDGAGGTNITGWTFENLGFVNSGSTAFPIGTNVLASLRNCILSNCNLALSFSTSNNIRTFKDLKIYACGAIIANSGNASLEFINCDFYSIATGVTPGPNWVFKNCRFKSWGTAVVFIGLSSSNTLLHKCNFNELSVASIAGQTTQSFLIEQDSVGATYSTNIFLVGATAIRWQTATKQGSDPGAWEINSITSNRPAGSPIVFKLAQIYCASGVAKTVSVWMQKNHATNGACSIFAEGSVLDGVDETETIKANDTNWEQVSITFTPSESGVIGIYARAWFVNGTSNVFIGSLTES